MRSASWFLSLTCLLCLSACSQPTDPQPKAETTNDSSELAKAEPTAPPVDEPKVEEPQAEPPNTPDAKEEPAPEPTKPTTAERLAKLRQLSGLRPRTPQQAIQFNKDAVAAAEDILNNPDATEEQVRDAKTVLMTKLAQGASMGMDGYDARLRALVDEVNKEDPNGKLAAMGATTLFQLDHLRRGSTVDASTLDAALAFLKQFPDEQESGLRLLMMTGDMAEAQDNTDVAVRAYQAIQEKFPGHRLASRAEGTIRRIELTGKTFPFEGTLVSGEPLDPESLKGKVVVIDFWATWCGPCIAEIPNMLRLYEEFHDQGFEIVGISLDKDKEKLDAFIQDRELPWPQTFPADGQPIGWENPLATKYGIGSIPRLFLIDREGTLVATKLRGPALEAKVRELMTPSSETQAEPEAKEPEEGEAKAESEPKEAKETRAKDDPRGE